MAKRNPRREQFVILFLCARQPRLQIIVPAGRLRAAKTGTGQDAAGFFDVSSEYDGPEYPFIKLLLILVGEAGAFLNTRPRCGYPVHFHFTAPSACPVGKENRLDGAD